MALDPSIILGVKPVEEVADPYRQYQVAAGLKDAAQQRQVRDLEIQGLQQQQKTDAALNDALSKATVVDPKTGMVNTDRAAALAQLKQGGFGKAALGLQEGWQKSDLAKSKEMLEQQGTVLKNQAMHTEAVGQIAQAILSAPLENQPVVYAQARASAIQRGIISPDELPDQYSPQNMQMLADQSLKVKDHLDAQAKLVDQHLKTVDLAQQADKAANELALGQGRLSEEIRSHNMTNAVERQNAAINAGRLGLERQKNTIETGGALDAMATAIAQGDKKALPTSRNNPFNQAVMKRAYEINPQLTDALYTTKQQFKTGNQQSTITALGTAMMHADEALQASQKIGTAPLINSSGALGSLKSSGDATYKTAADFLAGEIAKVVTGKGMTVDEGERITKNLYATRQSVRDSAIKEMLTLGGGKLKAVAQSYKTGTKQDFPVDEYFNDPSIKESLQRHGILGGSSGTVKMRAPNGQEKDVPADQVEHYKSHGAIEVK